MVINFQHIISIFTIFFFIGHPLRSVALPSIIGRNESNARHWERLSGPAEN